MRIFFSGFSLRLAALILLLVCAPFLRSGAWGNTTGTGIGLALFALAAMLCVIAERKPRSDEGKIQTNIEHKN